jgi:hypothetical protein
MVTPAAAADLLHLEEKDKGTATFGLIHEQFVNGTPLSTGMIS